MSGCLSYDCQGVFGEHAEIQCSEYVKGGFTGALLLTCDSNITNPSDQTEIANEIAAGTAILVNAVRMSVPEASPNEVSNPVPCRPDIVTTYDRTVTLVDSNVSEANRVNVYTPLAKGKPLAGLIIHGCGTDQVYWINDELNAVGSLVLPETDTEFASFTFTLKWRSDEDPSIHTTPPGIFT